jgi:hypothetical protein
LKEQNLFKFEARLVLTKEGKFFLVVNDENIELNNKQVVRLLAALAKKQVQ